MFTIIFNAIMERLGAVSEKGIKNKKTTTFFKPVLDCRKAVAEK